MNHDDEKNPELQAWIEPELEARLVAAVLGEASAFEIAELDRLALEKPELLIFKRRIEAVHGLIGLAARPEQTPLRLSPERREKILRLFGATSPRPAHSDENLPLLRAFAESRRKRRKKWIWASSLAASLLFAAILGSVMAPSLQPVRIDSFATVLGPSSVRVSLPMQSPVAGESPEDAERPGRTQFSDSLRMKSAPPPARLVEATLMDRRRELTPPGKQLPYGSNEPAKLEGFISTASKLARQQMQDSGNVDLNRVFKTTTDKKQIAAAPGVGGYGGGLGAVAPATPATRDLGAISQNQPDSGADEIVKLSPFEVSESVTGSYAAASSLAGSRQNTVQLQSFSVARKAAMRRSAADSAPDSTEPSKVFLGDDITTEGAKLYVPAAGQPEVRSAEPSMPSADADLPVVRPISKTGKPDESLRAEIATRTQPVSTFSLHVSDVSFRLAQAALARGETPDPERIRPEEFYNAFDYGDPSPSAAEKISSRIEQAAHPLLQQRNLVRIAVKVGSTGRGAGQPLNLTVMLDTSGSMEREDRILSVQRALGVLASLLGANDRVTLIGFAQRPRLLVENLPGNQAAKLSELAAQTPYTGGTNLEEALQLAEQLAVRHHGAGAQNRIVLITDGAANLGNADPEQLGAKIEKLRQQGIAFDACGVGTDGLDDAILEALTRKGDGRYYLLSKPEDADEGFARKLAGAFRPAAENVKLQVRFNPARVGHYRLIGFEQHRLREEDFRNDKVDAAELAADEAAVALYQVEVLPQGEGELGEVFVRFRDAATSTMVERSWTIRHEPHARALDRSTPTMQLAGIAALLAEKLRGGESAQLIDLAELAPAVNSLRGHYPNDARVQQLIAMFDQLRRQGGK